MGRAQTPERVAAAVAVGVGVGLSPFIGFHFLMAIGLAFLFRLNKLDTVLGSLIGNPWTLPPFFAVGYRVGRALLGYAPARGAGRSSGSASSTRTSGSRSAGPASGRAWPRSSSGRRSWRSSPRSPRTG